MFSKKIEFDIELCLVTFTHCRLFFHSTGDYYFGTIAGMDFERDYFKIHFHHLARCFDYIADHNTREKKWSCVKQYNRYTMFDFDLRDLRNRVVANCYNGTELTWKFRLQNGDEIFFTKDLTETTKISEVLNTTL